MIQSYYSSDIKVDMGVWWVMVFNATFNNISALSWLPVLLIEETAVPEKTTDLSQVNDKLLSHNVYLVDLP